MLNPKSQQVACTKVYTSLQNLPVLFQRSILDFHIHYRWFVTDLSYEFYFLRLMKQLTKQREMLEIKGSDLREKKTSEK